jgi:hypothetical protein
MILTASTTPNLATQVCELAGRRGVVVEADRDDQRGKKDVAARIANNARENLTDVGVISVGLVDSVGRDAQFINNPTVGPE